MEIHPGHVGLLLAKITERSFHPLTSGKTNEQAAGVQASRGLEIVGSLHSRRPLPGHVSRYTPSCIFHAAIAAEMHPPGHLDREVTANYQSMLEARSRHHSAKCEGHRFPLSFFKLACVHLDRGQSTHQGVHFITCYLVAFLTEFIMSRYTCTGILYMRSLLKTSIDSHGQMYWLGWPST